jgi:hypothetical protein
MTSSSKSNTNHDQTTTNTPLQQHGATALVLRIAVGSNNPVKVQAVRRALERVVQQSEPRRHETIQLQISSFDVPSGVSDQPFGDVSENVTVRPKIENIHDLAHTHCYN